MSEHPILFSGPMVRAILDGRKTQTRRVIKWKCNRGPDGYDTVGESKIIRVPWTERTLAKILVPECPYGVPGDRLWVRETWGKDLYAHLSGHVPILYKVGPPSIDPDYPVKWNPSIHMPRWASRLTLEVVEVRAQRLQDITEQDAIAEGVSCVAEFRELWDSINAKRAPWDSNPWVWAVTFRRVDNA